MPNSPSYLPVYTLAENTSPTSSDYFVFQGSGSSGDVGLLSVSRFLDVFMQDYIDQIDIDDTTKAKFTAMGWVEPTS